MVPEKNALTPDQWIRLLFTVFLAGSAWARFEYKMDQVSLDLHSSFEKYTIQNEADKVMINYRHQMFESNVSASISSINDFIKPDEVRIKKRKN